MLTRVQSKTARLIIIFKLKHAYYYIKDITNQYIIMYNNIKNGEIKKVTTTSSKTKQVFLNCPPQLSNIRPQRQASRSKIEYLISFVFNDVCHNCYFNQLLINSFFFTFVSRKKNCWAAQDCEHLLQLKVNPLKFRFMESLRHTAILKYFEFLCQFIRKRNMIKNS